MSRGLGNVERRILNALQASRYGHTELQSLVYLVAGIITELGEDIPDRTEPICAHRETITDEGGEYISDIGHHYWPCPAPNGSCYLYCQTPVGWINQIQVVHRPVHTDACFPAWVEPSHACQRAVSRAVRSLARKGLVARETTGARFATHYPQRYTTVWRLDAWAAEQQRRAEQDQKMRRFLTQRLTSKA